MISRVVVPLIYGSIAVRAIALSTKLLLVFCLPVSSYADYSIMFALFLTLLPLSTFNMAATLSRGHYRARGLAAYVPAAIILVVFLSAICSFLFTGRLDIDQAGKPKQALLFVLFFGFLFQGLIAIYAGGALSRGESYEVAKIESIDAICKLIVTVIILACGYLDALYLFSAQLLASVITLFFIVRKSTLAISICGPYLSAIWLLLMDGGKFVACSIIFLAYFFFLRESLYLVDKGYAASFDLAIVFYSLPKMLFSAVSRAIIPLAGTNALKLSGYGKKLLWMIVSSAFLSLTIYYVQGNKNFLFLLERFELTEYQMAFTCLAILILGAVFDFLYGVLSSYLFGMGSYRVVMVSSLIAVAILASLTSMVIQFYGLLGAAALYIATYGLSLGLIVTWKKDAFKSW